MENLNMNSFKMVYYSHIVVEIQWTWTEKNLEWKQRVYVNTTKKKNRWNKMLDGMKQLQRQILTALNSMKYSDTE